VRLTGVSHTWPDAATPTLSSIDLSVKRGDIIGIAGDSGQGKSTLINLLAGFVKPTAGTISRDEHWAWLGQHPHLFHASLRDNLLLGAAATATTTDSMLEAQLAKVGLALPDPLLPSGLDTAIGETNRGVSGGQAQRIALCRAMLSEATLWLLDEPTAALDADTSNKLVQAMVQHARDHNITLIVASHDNEVLAQCDRVVVVKDQTLQERV